ncbi:TldD/PmbA family protein [Emergencia sp. 1XD21-10]|uniref:TldD/PmbA family protein n=1 Tax=Emergencia sp. 1XD21-10 TaxID=2304569 RepID=UPI00137945DC|nr:metallopeptidase TldD-related protein [Emergencia sp. 1XD21-10]NCE99790.1 TldD/PmbA family protein [Emergencia sp. 1XD21-10]
MRITLDQFKNIFSNLPSEVTEAEVNAERREECLVTICDDKVRDSRYFDTTSMYLRAVGEKTGTGYLYTEDMNADPEALLLEALANAPKGENTKKEPMHHCAEPVRIFAEDDGTDYDQMKEKALFLVKSAREKEGVISAELTLRKTCFTRYVVNTWGVDAYAENVYYMVTLQVAMKRESGKPQKGTKLFCVKKLADLDFEKLLQYAIAEANLLDGAGKLVATEIPSGTYDVVLSNEVVCNILMTAWQLFSGDHMVSGLSPLADALNSRVGSDLFTVISGAKCDGWGYDIPVDAEGTVCEETEIVKDGIFKSPMTNHRASEKLGLKATGHGGRGITLTGMLPIDLQTLPNVFYIKPGKTPKEELTDKLLDGLHITCSSDEFHSVHVADGSFSIPCKGVVYENGAAIGYADQLTMAGNLRDLFENIAAVGEDLQLHEFDYKNYCYGGPSLLVKNVMIGGNKA